MVGHDRVIGTRHDPTLLFVAIEAACQRVGEANGVALAGGRSHWIDRPVFIESIRRNFILRTWIETREALLGATSSPH